METIEFTSTIDPRIVVRGVVMPLDEEQAREIPTAVEGDVFTQFGLHMMLMEN
jgi:hypothetical protein